MPYRIKSCVISVSIKDLIISSFSSSCFCRLFIFSCKIFIFLFPMCCLLVRTFCRPSDNESILSRGTESSWSVKVFNEFGLWAIWTIHSLCEFSKTGRLLETWGVSIWHCGGVSSSLGKLDLNNSVVTTNCYSSSAAAQSTVSFIRLIIGALY